MYKIYTLLKTKRIVITGGPGTGKTTLINYLENLNYACSHEVSREVTLEAQKDGIEQLFLEKPILFSEKLLEKREQQFHALPNTTHKFLFYDRAIPDIPAYMDYLKTPYPNLFNDSCKNHTYDIVFILPPWEEIYKQDNERYESYEQALSIYNFLLEGYKKYGYNPIVVPKGTLEERKTFIFEHLNAYS